MGDLMNKIKSAMQGEEQAEKGLLQQVDDAITLTWKQRLIGAASCFGLGLLLSIVSIPMLWGLQITKFAVFYSLGSVISICSTMFLMGPVKQCQRMLESQRILATIVYFASIVITLIVAFKVGNAGLCLVMLIVQTLALVWYMLTWIPGGQAMLKGMIFRT